MSSTLVTWGEEPTHWKRPWSWERLRAGEGDDKGWDGWMASPLQWTWVCAKCRREWRTEKPGVLQPRGLQRVRHHWAIDNNSKKDEWLPRWLGGQESTCQCRRHGFDHWIGKIPWRKEWQPAPGFFLRNPMDRRAWWATVHGVESQAWLSTHTKTCIRISSCLLRNCNLKGETGHLGKHWRNTLKYKVYMLSIFPHRQNAVRASRRGRPPPDGMNKEGFTEGGGFDGS